MWPRYFKVTDERTDMQKDDLPRQYRALCSIARQKNYITITSAAQKVVRPGHGRTGRTADYGLDFK